MAILIADSGSTKCEWCLVGARKKHKVFTQGLSPYFLSDEQMTQIIEKELLPGLPRQKPLAVYFYGTGNKARENARRTKKVLSLMFPEAEVFVQHDLFGAARALCRDERGVACILGTGSNSAYYDGRNIRINSPGLGYVLGDEGSGAYLGKKILQYYLYDTFDKYLKEQLEQTFNVNAADVLENVYRKPLPNRYLASFTPFLSANRGHYMIENIIEDGINDFFIHHLLRYNEIKKYPVHFTGSIAYYFKDVVMELCQTYGFVAGNILKNPMDGLIKFHKS